MYLHSHAWHYVCQVHIVQNTTFSSLIVNDAILCELRWLEKLLIGTPVKADYSIYYLEPSSLGPDN